MNETARPARISGLSDSTSATTNRRISAKIWKRGKVETTTCLSLNRNERPRGEGKEKVFGMTMRIPSTTTRVSLASFRSRWVKLMSDQAPNQRHWHYPANFEGAASGTGRKKLGFGRKASNTDNVDRWERSVRSSFQPAMRADDSVLLNMILRLSSHTPPPTDMTMMCLNGAKTTARSAGAPSRMPNRLRRLAGMAAGVTPTRMRTMLGEMMAGDNKRTGDKYRKRRRRMISSITSSRCLCA